MGYSRQKDDQPAPLRNCRLLDAGHRTRNFRAFLLLWLCVPCFAIAQPTVGITRNSALSYDGYTLFGPMLGRSTYLIDNCGYVVKQWESQYQAGLSAYLLADGSLLRTGRLGSRFNAGGSGGRLERYTWEGDLSWSYNYSSDEYQQHHDIEPMPNGNILLIAWERLSYDEAVALGRDPDKLLTTGLWPLHIVEIEPRGARDAGIVWEWHITDHLIQDHDSTKANFGQVNLHPELVDFNYFSAFTDQFGVDWIHANSIAYDEELDQVLVSSRNFCEVWVIDHSTTTEEAASHSGGRSGKGGDILYRWGNPAAWGGGSRADQRFFAQHDARWLNSGDSVSVMVFNNGVQRPEGTFSTIDEISLPWNAEEHTYELDSTGVYGPAELSWTYDPVEPDDFFAPSLSGAQRLPNGNTLVCDGPHGRFVEVTPAGEAVWEYVNPVAGDEPIRQGDDPAGNSVFRVMRFARTHAAVRGRPLDIGTRLELDPLTDDCTVVADTSTSVITAPVRRVLFEVLGNPFDGHLVLRNQGTDVLQFTITDLNGSVIAIFAVTGSIQITETADWPQGVYLVTAKAKGNSAMQCALVVKQ